MKQTTLFLFVIFSITILSCSSDDTIDRPDYTGTWKFNRGFVTSSFETDTDILSTYTNITNDDCSIKEIIINADGTAIVKSLSILDVSVQFTENVTNQIEQMLNCTSVTESTETYNWLAGPYYDGDNITFEVPGNPAINFIDENGKIQLSGTVYPNGLLSIGSTGINSRTYTSELNGENQEIKEERFFQYQKQ